MKNVQTRNINIMKSHKRKNAETNIKHKIRILNNKNDEETHEQPNDKQEHRETRHNKNKRHNNKRKAMDE